MNTQPFPPIILPHLTMDNAVFHGACRIGIVKFINTHQLSHLTAVPVETLLKSNQLTPDEIHWIKYISGLNLENEYEEGYGNRDGDGEDSTGWTSPPP